MLKLSVIGTGYLGATHAACMASMGFEVIGVDSNQSKIEALSKGELPFFEPGLDELLSAQVKSGRLKLDRKSTRLNSSHTDISRMPSSA